jgi:hypothetical protein
MSRPDLGALPDRLVRCRASPTSPRAARRSDWEPWTPLDVGLVRTAEWFRTYGRDGGV